MAKFAVEQSQLELTRLHSQLKARDVSLCVHTYVQLPAEGQRRKPACIYVAAETQSQLKARDVSLYCIIQQSHTPLLQEDACLVFKLGSSMLSRISPWVCVCRLELVRTSLSDSQSKVSFRTGMESSSVDWTACVG